MILGMGIPELLLILIVVLVIFGPKNLPKLGKSLGQTVKNVREGMEEGDGEKDVSHSSGATVSAATSTGDASTPSDAGSPSDDATPAPTCPNCHAKVPADADFCPHCGTRLDG